MAENMRIDKWLWQARFFKSRTLATKFCQSGKVQVNGSSISKPRTLIIPGDILTFTKGDLLKVIKVVALGVRRGPAPEAQALYKDESPTPEQKPKSLTAPTAHREPGQGRPTKAERRATDKWIDKLKDF